MLHMLMAIIRVFQGDSPGSFFDLRLALAFIFVGASLLTVNRSSFAQNVIFIEVKNVYHFLTGTH